MQVGHRQIVRARWSDMDSFQHINHAAAITLLEEARIPFLFGPDRPTDGLRTGMFIVELNVKYQGQLVYEDNPLQVVQHTTRVRAADFTIIAEIRAAGQDESTPAAVLSRAQLAAFDVEKQGLRRLTADEKAYLKEHSRD